ALQTELESQLPEMSVLTNELGDDRDNIRSGDLVLLIVDDDLTFARFMLDAARAKGFKGLVTSRGSTCLMLTHQFEPSAIALDIHLPDIDGWRILNRLKNELYTRHIPVFLITGQDDAQRGLGRGAVSVAVKPVRNAQSLAGLVETIHDFITRGKRHLLVVEPDRSWLTELSRMLENDDIQFTAVGSLDEALRLLSEQQVD